jgi:hypothetical protein
VRNQTLHEKQLWNRFIQIFLHVASWKLLQVKCGFKSLLVVIEHSNLVCRISVGVAEMTRRKPGDL